MRWRERILENEKSAGEVSEGATGIMAFLYIFLLHEVTMVALFRAGTVFGKRVECTAFRAVGYLCVGGGTVYHAVLDAFQGMSKKKYSINVLFGLPL